MAPGDADLVAYRASGLGAQAIVQPNSARTRRPGTTHVQSSSVSPRVRPDAVLGVCSDMPGTALWMDCARADGVVRR